MNVEASAPGKLFLLGEYAVLEGAPAILTPVAQRARVRIAQGETATMLTGRRERMATRDAIARVPLLGHIASRIIEAGLVRKPLAEPLQTGALSLTLDTSGFFHRGAKLGLGSSAALTAALVKAFCDRRRNLVDAAIACHRAFQGGVGSGADVALAMIDTSIVFTPGQGARRVPLPPSLSMLFIWSGAPASTTRYLSGMAQYKKAQPRAYRAAIRGLGDLAAAGVAALDADDAAGFTDAVAACDEALLALSETTRLNFYTEAHLRLRKRVELAGCIYKPSGAGGGDFGVACSTSGERLIGLKDAMEREGHLAFLSQHTAARDIA